jgi:microcystin-dependent protein
MQNNISKFTVAFIISLVVIGVLFAQEVGILVAPNGNVGIGTENPTAALEVNGRIKDKTGFIMPVGTILPYGGETAPEGWLLCNGDAKSRTDFADLFAAIGTNFGQGDGSATFNVPDLRGRFLRGADFGAGLDPDAASRTAMNFGGNAGDNVGSVQADELRRHRHPLYMMTSSVDNQDGIRVQKDTHEWNYNYGTGYTGGNETRPVNAAVNYIIKY